MGHHGQGDVPHYGPQRDGVCARAHARGGLHRHGPLAHLVVPRPAAERLPDQHQVPRRDPPALRGDAQQGIHHEGRLFLRPGRGRPRDIVSGDAAGVSPHLPARGDRHHSGRGRYGGDGRERLRGVHGGLGGGRGGAAHLPTMRIPGEPGARHPCPEGVRRRR